VVNSALRLIGGQPVYSPVCPYVVVPSDGAGRRNGRGHGKPEGRLRGREKWREDGKVKGIERRGESGRGEDGEGCMSWWTFFATSRGLLISTIRIVDKANCD